MLFYHEKGNSYMKGHYIMCPMKEKGGPPLSSDKILEIAKEIKEQWQKEGKPGWETKGEAERERDKQTKKQGGKTPGPRGRNKQKETRERGAATKGTTDGTGETS